MVFKFIQIVLLASMKYFLTIPYAMLIGLEYKYAVFAMVLGGLLGFFFFYLLTSRLILLFRKIRKHTSRMMPVCAKSRFQFICNYFTKPKEKVIFTRKNRFIVKLKRNYGIWGIVITTPVLLSIPVGAFLANYYYPGNKRIIYYMMISIILWGTLLSGILLLFPNFVH
jgi:hypothetical protein